MEVLKDRSYTWALDSGSILKSSLNAYSSKNGSNFTFQAMHFGTYLSQQMDTHCTGLPIISAYMSKEWISLRQNLKL